MPPAKSRVQASVDPEVNKALEGLWREAREKAKLEYGLDLSFSAWFNQQLRIWLSRDHVPVEG